jgi:hypothetical protein
MMRRRARIGVIAAGALSLCAQQPTFKTETRVVVLRATVQNHHGAEVTDLDQNDEPGARRRVPKDSCGGVWARTDDRPYSRRLCRE